MSPIPGKISDIKESFEHLVRQNYEAQGDVKAALKSEDYLKAVKIIDNYVKIVEEFTIKTIKMAQKYKEKADDENASISNQIVKMANHIKTAHLEVEENILRKYIKK